MIPLLALSSSWVILSRRAVHIPPTLLTRVITVCGLTHHIPDSQWAIIVSQWLLYMAIGMSFVSISRTLLIGPRQLAAAAAAGIVWRVGSGEHRELSRTIATIATVGPSKLGE